MASEISEYRKALPGVGLSLKSFTLLELVEDTAIAFDAKLAVKKMAIRMTQYLAICDSFMKAPFHGNSN